MKDSISGSSILLTGGTGSFGKCFLNKILLNYPNIKRLVIYSRDELKQWELRSNYPAEKYPQLRFFIGDVRDRDRLRRSLEGIDTIIHAAALKQVPTAEYNPIEFIKTNILGAENLIEASLDTNVKRIVALSTDKAAAPINLYGATKLCSDKLFIAANNIKGSRDLKLSVVRYGNVMGSRGSVIPVFLENAKKGILEITNAKMTRFNISLEESVNLVFWAINESLGGELFVPKIPSYKILDLANAIGPNCQKKIIGIRSGEKIHEEMITTSDSYNTIDIGKYFIILPTDGELLKKYEERKIKFKFFAQGKSYNSGNNEKFLTVEEIRELIIKNINKEFVPI